GYRTEDFPAFYARTSGRKTDRRCDTAQDAAKLIAAQRRLGLGGLLVANPIPPEYALDADAIERLVDHGGSDIAVLRADLERVLTYCSGRAAVTEDDVRAVVGGETVHDDWAIVRAIENGDASRALRLLALMLEG
ncbi:MAG: pseudouridine-5'-phosphate glycosidase, partial [Rhodospirillales bacterium]